MYSEHEHSIDSLPTMLIRLSEEVYGSAQLRHSSMYGAHRRFSDFSRNRLVRHYRSGAEANEQTPVCTASTNMA